MISSSSGSGIIDFIMSTRSIKYSLLFNFMPGMCFSSSSFCWVPFCTSLFQNFVRNSSLNWSKSFVSYLISCHHQAALPSVWCTKKGGCHITHKYPTFFQLTYFSCFRFIYIIMEYCDAGDLSNFIRKRKTLPEHICQRFMQQLAVALKFLRSYSICHLDLKPQNLLLVSQPNLVLKVGGELKYF